MIIILFIFKSYCDVSFMFGYYMVQIALGAFYDPDGFQSARAQRDLQTAKAITYTCYQMFERSGMILIFSLLFI